MMKRLLMWFGRPSAELSLRMQEKLNQHLLEARLVVEAIGEKSAERSLLQKVEDVQAALRQLTPADAGFVVDESGKGTFLVSSSNDYGPSIWMDAGAVACDAASPVTGSVHPLQRGEPLHRRCGCSRQLGYRRNGIGWVA